MNFNLLLIFPVLFLGGIISICAGGGLGIIMLILFSYFFDVRTAVILASLSGFVVNPVKLWYFYKNIDWHVVQWYVIAGLPTSFIGGFLLFIIPERIVEITVGVFCILFVLMKYFHYMPVLPKNKALIVFLSAFNGVLGGVIGNAGIIRIPTLMAFGLTKEHIMATSAMISFIMNFGKVSVYMTKFIWTTEIFIVLGISFISILLGLRLGKKALPHISVHIFEKLLLCIIFIGAIRLLL